MNNNPNAEYYYNGDDWRLFDPNDFNTISIFETKKVNWLTEKDFNQVELFVEKIKNKPY